MSRLLVGGTTYQTSHDSTHANSTTRLGRRLRSLSVTTANKRPSANCYYRWSLSGGRSSSQHERQVNHSMFRKYFCSPWHTAKFCIRQRSTIPEGRNSAIYVYKWYQTPQNYTDMATSQHRSRDANETVNEVSTDSSHRTKRLENPATTIPAELPSHTTLYNESTAGHSTIRTKHSHKVTREAIFKHGRARRSRCLG